jgi:hypothetical protein
MLFQSSRCGKTKPKSTFGLRYTGQNSPVPSPTNLKKASEDPSSYEPSTSDLRSPFFLRPAVIASRRCVVGLDGRSWALKTLGNAKKERQEVRITVVR